MCKLRRFAHPTLAGGGVACIAESATDFARYKWACYRAHTRRGDTAPAKAFLCTGEIAYALVDDVLADLWRISR